MKHAVACFHNSGLYLPGLYSRDLYKTKMFVILSYNREVSIMIIMSVKTLESVEKVLLYKMLCVFCSLNYGVNIKLLRFFF